MQYGDNDTYGNPRRMIDTFLREAERHGIPLDVDALNAYDIGITTTGPGVAILVDILRNATPRTPEQRDTLVTELIDFPNPS